MAVPLTIGRIPRKVASAFGGFTAEQWINWTLVYALRGLISEEHYECWRSFVLACRLLTVPILLDNIDYVTGIGNVIRRSTPNAGFAFGSGNQWLLGFLRLRRTLAISLHCKNTAKWLALLWRCH